MITNDDIRSLFGRQLEKIGDDELRDKVVATWVEGCRRGGWQTVEELTSMPFTLLTDTHGMSFIAHTIAVTEGALGLAEAQLDALGELPYPIDLDDLVAGGLLHDVGKLMEIEKDGRGGYRKSYHGKALRHPISGAVLAGEMGLSLEIQNIIACHSKEGEGRPKVAETILVHLADFATFDPLVALNDGKLVK